LSDSILVTQNGVRKSFRIEAEDYIGMLGLQTEATSDFGGGLNLGYVDAGDWVTYNLDITIAGTYDVIFRHAGYEGDFDVYIDNTYLKRVIFPATSGWQTWTSHTIQMGLHEGQHVMKFTFNKEGVNLNWMQFDWTDASGTDHIADDDGMNVYPVPADKYLNIEFNSLESPYKIQLLSLDGRMILSLDCLDRYGEVIDVSDLDEGIYVLRIIFDTRISNKKIIITRQD